MTNLQKNTKIICVYKVTNPIGQIYIGGTTHYNYRVRFYKELRCYRQPKITESLKKYGAENHSYEIIEVCDLGILKQRESYYARLYDVLGKNGLNSAIPKLNGKGNCISEETRLAMSESAKKVVKQPMNRKGKEMRRKKWIGRGNPRAVTLLNTETGIYYDTIQDAANSVGVNYGTFKSRIRKGFKKMPFITV